MQETGNYYEDVDNLFPQGPGEKDVNRWNSRVSQNSSNEPHNFKCFVKTSHIIGYRSSPGNSTAANLSEKLLIHLMVEDKLRHYHHPKITAVLIIALLAVVSLNFESQFTCHQLIKEGAVMPSFIRVTHLRELGNSVHALVSIASD